MRFLSQTGITLQRINMHLKHVTAPTFSFLAQFWLESEKQGVTYAQEGLTNSGQ